MSTADIATEAGPPGTIHPLVVRVTHWINAAAMLVMIGSGWQIYNADPILPFSFPAAVTVGGWLGGALLWHFAAMWLLVANFIVYVGSGLISGRIGRKMLPITASGVIADTLAAFRGRLAHADLAHYNSVQKLLYLGVIGLIALAVLSGLAIWKPVQLYWLTALLGGFQGARVVHFLAMIGIVGFLLVHVGMALLVPRTIRAMIVGR